MQVHHINEPTSFRGLGLVVQFDLFLGSNRENYDILNRLFVVLQANELKTADFDTFCLH